MQPGHNSEKAVAVLMFAITEKANFTFQQSEKENRCFERIALAHFTFQQAKQKQMLRTDLGIHLFVGYCEITMDFGARVLRGVSV